MITRILLAGLVSFVAGSLAGAQDLNAANAAFNARLNAAMNANQNAIVSQNLNDPRVQAAYRQHLEQGGRYTREQFAYMYAATGGFTPQGIAYFNATEARNNANEQAALNRLRQAQAERAQAQANLWAGYHRNNAEVGNLLQGNSTYTNPNTGSNYVLPHTLQAGQTYRDNAGNYFQTDARGNKYIYTNGWWLPLNAGR